MPENDESKMPLQLRKEKIIYLVLFALTILTFFMPYRVKTISGGQYTGFSGLVHNSAYSVDRMSGFEFPLSLIALVFLIGISVLSIFSRRKSLKIIALILVFFYVLFLLFLFVALTFHLNFGNQIITIKVGIGYVLLVVFSALFALNTIIAIRKNWNNSRRPVREFSNLLDDL